MTEILRESARAPPRCIALNRKPAFPHGVASAAKHRQGWQCIDDQLYPTEFEPPTPWLSPEHSLAQVKRSVK